MITFRVRQRTGIVVVPRTLGPGNINRHVLRIHGVASKKALEEKYNNRLQPKKGMIFEHASARFGDIPHWSKVVDINDGNVVYRRVKDDGELGFPLNVSVVNFAGMVIRVIETPDG